MKNVLLIVVIVIAVVLAVPLVIALGVVGIVVIAAIGGIGIGSAESVMMIDDTPYYHTSITGPHWSSDGRRIVFESHRKIYAIDAYGTHLEPISEDFGEFDFDAAPSLSPDGTEVVYTALRHDDKFITGWNREAVLVKSDLDGSRRSRIGERHPWEIIAVWSPQADRIAYVSVDSIYTMAADGSNVQQIVDLVAIGNVDIILPPVWSPDGEAMAFVVEDRDSIDGRPYVVYVVGDDGADLTELKATIGGPRTGPYADDGRQVRVPTKQPAWSPDGKRLAFVKRGTILTIDSDGSNPREVLDLTAELEFERVYRWDSWHCNLTWSPDGTEILVGNVGGSLIWAGGLSGSSYPFVPWRNLVVRSDGSGVRELPGPGGYASWSPDGARIAVRILTREDPESDRGIELYTVARDGSDARVLVKRRHEKGPKRGSHGVQDTIWILEAAVGEPLTSFPEVSR